MPVYIVSYDLTQPGQKYEPLWEALGKLGGKRILLSHWAVYARGPAKDLRDLLWKFMADPDRLLVMARDTGDWAATNLKIKLGDFQA